VDAHSHGFQRALRGRVEGGDFWAWRETMLELARGQTPAGVRREYADVYRELRNAGYTAAGEQIASRATATGGTADTITITNRVAINYAAAATTYTDTITYTVTPNYT